MPQNASAVALKALTEWWEEMGVDIDATQIKANLGTNQPPTGLQKEPTQHKSPTPAAPVKAQTPRTGGRRKKSKTLEDWVAEASTLAADAGNLTDLKTAIEGYGGSALKPLCENTVVFDGVLDAPVMVIGEGPGPQEDRLKLPFVGPAGQLLDKMLNAIKLDRKTNTFITNVNYWRPPGNRNPEADELAVCRPFVDRMVDLAKPKLMIAAGGVPAKSLLDTKTGIMRLRGTESMFTTSAGTSVPIIPMLHPAYLLRRPQDKSRAWRDLLMVQARLLELGVEV